CRSRGGPRPPPRSFFLRENGGQSRRSAGGALAETDRLGQNDAARARNGGALREGEGLGDELRVGPLEGSRKIPLGEMGVHLHRAELRPAHGAELCRLEGVVRQRLVVLALRGAGIEREPELLAPVEGVAGTAQGVVAVAGRGPG